MMELRDVLARLKGAVDQGGGQYMAQCPGHEDKRASLSLRMGEKGIVMHCLAGCQTPDVLKAMGLTMKDLFLDGDRPVRKARGKADAGTQMEAAPPSVPKKKTSAKPFVVGGSYSARAVDPESGETIRREETITRVYEYTDLEGKPLLQVARTDRKSFPVIHLDAGSWYWGDGGHGAILYHLPRLQEGIAQHQRIYLVEGEKDVEALEGLGLYATTNKGGANKWRSEISRQLIGARVVIIPDLDDSGRKHGRLVAKELEGFCREVRILNLRKLEKELPEKGDASDLVEKLGKEKARNLLEEAAATAPLMSRIVDDSAYAEYFDGLRGFSVQNGCICHFKNEAWQPLCNFTALPTEEIIRDDGQGDLSTTFKVAGWAGDGRRLPEVVITAEAFAQMSWPLKKWGLAANIRSGNGVKERLREAIQAAGDRSALRKIAYVHTGWRKINGKPVYLHGGGAIGEEEVVVDLDYGFNRYDLSGLVRGPGLEMSARQRDEYCATQSLMLMRVAGQRVGVPLVGYMFLTPLRHFLMKAGHRPSFIPFLRGRTGSGKSVMASLVLNHFGRDFSYDAAHPASFDDTANAISLKLFVLKDMPLLIDDYHPEENPQRRRAMEDVAQRVSRMIGDGAKRSRMRNDATGQEDKPARGLCIQTGEDLPRVTESGVARMYVIDLGKGDVPLGDPELTRLQQMARDGVFSQTMRGYITWLMEQYDELPERLSERYSSLLAEALTRVEGAHARIPPVVAMLMLGLQTFSDYLVKLGAMTASAQDGAMEGWWEAVLSNTRKQVAEMGDDKPTKIFTDTLRELMDSGRVITEHIQERQGLLPGIIGWRDKENYYLNPGLTFAAVQRALSDQGSSFPLGKNMTLKLLADEGMILRDPGSGKNVRQLNRSGVRAWVMWMPRQVLDLQEQQEMDLDPYEAEHQQKDGKESI